ncbi:hypothetical protein [Streptomyces olivaceiscleroticus]|uniref:Uncharacterized protein n=1 Tax=Streptomyces olivaceiscleroticus TaxID=68245 RepID=A0ABP3LFF0_9ACTN
MDSELAALAASGATTLVSLMVTDSWTHARELLGRFLSRGDRGSAVVADLDAARSRLLSVEAGGGPDSDRHVAEQWHGYLRRALAAGAISGEDLRDFVASLQRLAREADTQPVGVRNDISGGVQHGPVIQAGRISGLTFHAGRSAARPQD